MGNGLSQNLLSQIIKEQDNTVNLCHFLIDIRDKFQINFSTPIEPQLNVNCKELKLKFNHIFKQLLIIF